MNNDEAQTIAEAVHDVFRKIEQAARRAGRDPKEITFIAASKTVQSSAILAAASAGVRVFGENRVQEAMEKFTRDPLPPPNQLHLIGSLQMNKVKKAVGFFDLIHSIDSMQLAKKVNEEADRKSLSQSVLVQVNIGEEFVKGGVSSQDFPYLIDTVKNCSHLKLLGLMVIPPHAENPRPFFAKLRKMGESVGLTRLSMGMSSDYEAAIEEGASWVRIGTAIFGGRVSGK
jgi:pyridoxal phosphate enzyme (YggS family)